MKSFYNFKNALLTNQGNFKESFTFIPSKNLYIFLLFLKNQGFFHAIRKNSKKDCEILLKYDTFGTPLIKNIFFCNKKQHLDSQKKKNWFFNGNQYILVSKINNRFVIHRGSIKKGISFCLIQC